MVYKYTKPRGPIAAMYGSPGPCYGLPGLVGQQHHDPRSSHQRGPAFQFGVRHTGLTCDSSPGPCYRPGSRVDRHGRDGSPSYSLSTRHGQQTSFQTPGPGAYSPEATSPQTTRRSSPPAYSFGTRHRYRTDANSTPGPSNYSVPGMLGRTIIQSNKRQSPCYTLGGRCKIGSLHQDLQKTPGPGSYSVTDTNKYKKRFPRYSMSSRTLIVTDDDSCKPGPGAHSPERVWLHKREAPHFSFGIRHSQYSSQLILEPDNN